MATRPTSVRGKNTRLGKLKEVKKIIKEYEAKNSPSGLDSTKRLKLEKKTSKPKVPSQLIKRKKLSNMMPMVGAAAKGLSRAGMAGMNKAVFNKAKKLKPSGRLNASDMKRAKDMLKKRKTK
jgi:hypothetical protein